MLEPQRCSSSTSYLIEITANSKTWSMYATREELDDLPATKELRESALFLAKSLVSRFRNVDPNLFVTQSGRLLRIDPVWPPRPLLSANGGYLSASGTPVSITDVLSKQVAKCMVKMTGQQEMEGVSLGRFVRFACLVNSIRSDVDSNKIMFYESDALHPITLQDVEFRFHSNAKSLISIQDYISSKVWLLGFKAGRRETKVWLCDPWDATYLGCDAPNLHQEGAVLEAQDRLVLDESGEFASAGRVLLASNGPARVMTVSTKPTLQASHSQLHDVFISHASEDKPYVEPLARALEAAGVSVWYDKTSIGWGDDIRSSIDNGLLNCNYGVVVFSKAFLGKKKWTEYEVSALFGLETVERKRILPIWHEVTYEDVLKYSPALAQRRAKSSADDSNVEIVNAVLSMLGRAQFAPQTRLPNVLTAVDWPDGKKTNAVAYATYEIGGLNAGRIELYIRRSPSGGDRFVFKSSQGDELEGTRQQVASKYVAADKNLRMSGYQRRNVSGGGEFPEFSF